MNACGRGWASRCASAQTPASSCRCSCGGANHGTAMHVRASRNDSQTDDAVWALVCDLEGEAKAPAMHPAFPFDGIHRGQRCVTHLCYFFAAPKPVVIATERRHNPGASITNAAENLWKAVALKNDWTYEDFIAVEHYVKDRYGPSSVGIPRTLDRVILTGARVRWEHLSLPALKALLVRPT